MNPPRPRTLRYATSGKAILFAETPLHARTHQMIPHGTNRLLTSRSSPTTGFSPPGRHPYCLRKATYRTRKNAIRKPVSDVRICGPTSSRHVSGFTSHQVYASATPSCRGPTTLHCFLRPLELTGPTHLFSFSPFSVVLLFPLLNCSPCTFLLASYSHATQAQTSYTSSKPTLSHQANLLMFPMMPLGGGRGHLRGSPRGGELQNSCNTFISPESF